jgi:hypothetical protein
METKTCKNCKKEVAELFKGYGVKNKERLYCASCYYECALCEKCQEFHNAEESREWGAKPDQPASHLLLSFQKIGTVTALRMECRDCGHDFRRFPRDLPEGCVMIVEDEEINDET